MKRINRTYKLGVEATIEDKKFLIRQKLLGEAEQGDYEDFTLPHYVYEISVVRTDVPSDEYRFIYHGSFNDLKKGKKRLSETDLVLAFRMALEDALAYLNHENVDEFAKEYGIDRPSEAIRLWKACQNVYGSIKENLQMQFCIRSN